jgi:hypothetical protein
VLSNRLVLRAVPDLIRDVFPDEVGESLEARTAAPLEASGAFLGSVRGQALRDASLCDATIDIESGKYPQCIDRFIQRVDAVGNSWKAVVLTRSPETVTAILTMFSFCSTAALDFTDPELRLVGVL